MFCMNDYSFESGLDCDDIKEHRKEMLEEAFSLLCRMDERQIDALLHEINEEA